jgi:MFS transporter, DHA1 family, inner membrane transport protein
LKNVIRNETDTSDVGAVPSWRDPPRIGGICAIMVGVCGPLIFLTMPFFLTFVKLDRGFSASEISLISSADMIGMFVANVFAAYWIGFANWRLVSVASVATLIAATVWSLSAISFNTFCLSRVVAGFGAGTLMGIGLTAIGERRRAEAWFGWFVGAQAVLGMVTSWSIPRVLAPFGLNGFLMFLIAVYVLLLPFALQVPLRSGAIVGGRGARASSEKASLGLAVLSLVAAFAFYMGIFAIWSHIDLIGRAAGIDATSIGDAVALGYLLGVPASAVAIALAGRVGRLWIFLLIGLIQIAALLFLTPGCSLFAFRLATLMLGWLWYFAAPPQMAITVALDPTGRFIVLFVAAMKSSYAVAGVVLAVLLAGNGSLSRVVMLSGFCTLASMAMYSMLAIKSKVPRGQFPTPAVDAT